MRGLVIHTAKYATRGSCGHDISRGDTVATFYGRKGTLCHACTRKARGQEATALDHRISAARAGHATQAPAEPPAEPPVDIDDDT